MINSFIALFSPETASNLLKFTLLKPNQEAQKDSYLTSKIYAYFIGTTEIQY